MPTRISAAHRSRLSLLLPVGLLAGIPVALPGSSTTAAPQGGGLVVTGASSGPTGASTQAPATQSCAPSIQDQATAGCLLASSVPAAGQLFPPPHDGGTNNATIGPDAFVGGGKDNTASGIGATVTGGDANDALGLFTTVGGGGSNRAIETSATVGGGFRNVASGIESVIGGGQYNTVAGYAGTVAGGQNNDAAGYYGLFIGHATVAGGENNTAAGTYSFVGGGSNNTASGTYWNGFEALGHSTVCGGRNNTASGAGYYAAAVVGGSFNTATADYSFIGAGTGNNAPGHASVIGGGGANLTGNAFSVVGGGLYNQATGFHSTSSGGRSNVASAESSTVPGGRDNSATGDYSFAAGRRAKANHQGAFVWGDSNGIDKTSSANDQFNVYAAGGTRIFSNAAATSGVLLAAGGGSWTSVSDRGAKENVEAVDGREVLEALTGIEVTTWNYTAQGDSVRHMGPMAQDMWDAFGLGLGGTTIDTIDADGLALAAIQGVNEKLEAEVEALRRANELLAKRVRALESLQADVEALKAATR